MMTFMLTWCKIGVRNLFRNGRRSMFTIIAIGLGFLAVNALGGFTAYIFTSLKDSYIYGEANGHLTVFKNGFLDKGKLDPVRYLLSEKELATIRGVLANYPEVVVATPALQVSGLLSNGQVSTIFVGTGRVPSDIRAIGSRAIDVAGKIKLYDGKPLADDMEYGIGVSHGLAQQLNLKMGATAVAMAPTVSGQINALDGQLLQLIDAPIDALEDKLTSLPLAFAQKLYDTTSVDRVTVLLRDDSQTYAMRARLAKALTGAGLDVELKTWNELSPFYTKVKKMFNVIFLITFLIVFLIVVMSVVNTVGMSVMERTREIGTLRALGVKRRGIVALFAMESMILGAFGSLLGVVLMLAVTGTIQLLHPTWVPPQITRAVPLHIYLVAQYWLYSVILLLFLSLFSAIFPARKAARMEITSALGFA
jgi:putative ABC transport system permease protein